MAAAAPTQAEFRALFATLGWTNGAAQELVVSSGLDSWAEIRDLDADGCKDICAVIRKPGGGAAGRQVSSRSQDNLVLLTYFARHQARVSRTIVIGNVNQDVIRGLRRQRDLERHWSDNITDYIKPDLKDMAKTMESTRDLLSKMRGSTHVRLSFCVRRNLRPADEADDPATNYESIDDEMIARHPILLDNDPNGTEEDGPWDPFFLMDQAKVWDVLDACWRDSPLRVHGKATQAGKKGRKYWRKIFDMYLGAHMVDHMAASIDATLRGLTFVGNKRNWTFEKYEAAHIAEHNRQMSLVEYGQHEIDGLSKVRHLLNGIKTKDLDAPRAQILASAELRSDFSKATSLFKDYIKQQSLNNPTARQVSSTSATQKRSGPGRGEGGPRGRKRGKSGLPTQAEVDACTHIQDKFYPKEEYAKFTPAEAQKHWQLRQKRLNRDKASEKDKELEKIRRRVKALETKDNGESDDDKSLFSHAESEGVVSSEEDETNANNKHLMRQRKVSFGKNSKKPRKGGK